MPNSTESKKRSRGAMSDSHIRLYHPTLPWPETSACMAKDEDRHASIHNSTTPKNRRAS